MTKSTPFERKTYDAGDFIFREGEFADAIYSIIRGTIEIRTTTGDGKIHTIATLHKGKVFGEMALIEGRNRQASVVALEETEVIEFPRKEFFLRLLMLDPLMRKVIVHLAVLLHQTTDKLNKCEDR